VEREDIVRDSLLFFLDNAGQEVRQFLNLQCFPEFLRACRSGLAEVQGIRDDKVKELLEQGDAHGSFWVDIA